MTANSGRNNNEVDVIICGGGVAGQTLARQLKLNCPDVSILLLEKASFPVQEATHKVGESTVDESGHYLTDKLQLESYMAENHIKKLGFRYFWQENGTDCFSQRTEFGLSEYYYPFHSYQIDIGRFENDLCKMNMELGVHIYDQASVTDITINDTQLHEVHYKHLPSEERRIVRGRWVIDAMGRRCFLQKKFGLQVKSEQQCGAVWFRLKGKLDLTDLVPESEKAWHQRVPNQARYYSTNHLLGRGYWIWLIPLSSESTSVGIVTLEEFHPFSTYSTYERAIAWLEQHDPVLCHKIQEYEVMDFLKVRNYSYSSQQVFSEQRWACVGNAALFADPFFSLGGLVIASANSCITRMVELDLQNKLTKNMVDSYNDLVISRNDTLTKEVQDSYSYFHDSQVFTLNFIWGLSITWGLELPIAVHSLYLDLDRSEEIDQILSECYSLSHIMNDIFLEWAVCSKNRFTFEFMDYRRIPVLEDLQARYAIKHSSAEELKESLQYVRCKLEEFSQVVFLLIVEDVMPEKLAIIPKPVWLNAWAMSLSPDKWQEDGLFEPDSEPRELEDMMSQMRALYAFKSDEK